MMARFERILNRTKHQPEIDVNAKTIVLDREACRSGKGEWTGFDWTNQLYVWGNMLRIKGRYSLDETISFEEAVELCKVKIQTHP